MGKNESVLNTKIEFPVLVTCDREIDLIVADAKSLDTRIQELTYQGVEKIVVFSLKNPFVVSIERTVKKKQLSLDSEETKKYLEHLVD